MNQWERFTKVEKRSKIQIKVSQPTTCTIYFSAVDQALPYYLFLIEQYFYIQIIHRSGC